MKAKRRFMEMRTNFAGAGRAWAPTCLALALIGPTAARVYAGQSASSIQKPVVRSLEVLDLGYRLPIEIVKVKNLQAKHWMRDLEIEIRNISTKPIYEIYVALWLPDDNQNGVPYGVTMRYGAMRFVNPRQRPSADDIPIAPGEIVKLKVEEPLWSGYENHTQKRGNVSEQAGHRVRLVMEDIQFGDGTGFIHGGVPYSGDDKANAKYKRYVIVPEGFFSTERQFQKNFP